MSEHRACIVIPVFNHGKQVGAVLDGLASLQLPVILVDDGSGDETRDILKRLAQEKKDFCTLYRLEENQGKGGAVIKGLIEAEEAGYTHALQVDADGQHDLNEISKFLSCSRDNPLKLVCGRPVYDETVPSSRKSGRKITNFWVTLETLSTEIEDAMCGFRVYPLRSTNLLLKKGHLGKRMEFDIEILVKLYWRKVRMVFLPVKVIYPEDGLSNFRMLHDNVAISMAHTRLFLGMIIRLPILLSHKITLSRKRAA